MNLAVIAARAAKRPVSPRQQGRPSTDLLARVQTVTDPAVGSFRNRKAVRMTGAQRDSTGKPSAWNRSPFAPKGGWR